MDGINFYSLLSLFGSVANFSLALFVYLKDRKSPVNITFALLNLCSAGWNLGLFIVFSTSDKNLALFGMGKIVFPSLAFIPAFFFHFVLVITGSFTRAKKKLTIATYALGFVLAIIAIYDSHLYVKDLLHYSWGYYHVPGIFNHIYNFVYAFFSVYGCYLLFNAYRATKSAIRKNQFKYLLLSVGIALFGGMFNFPIMVSVTKMPVGNMSIVLYSLLVTYAIARYRLMEINVFLKKGTIYLTAFTFAAAALFLIMQFSPKNILGYDFGNLFPCLVVTIFMFVLIRLYPNMHNSVERVFPSEKSYLINGIEQLGDQILSKTGLDVNKLIKDTFENLITILGLSGGCMFCREAGGEKYNIVYATGCCSNSENSASIPRDNSLIDILSAKEEPIVKEELDLMVSLGSFEQSEKEKLLAASAQLDEFGVAVCIPLITRGNITGLFNLGSKKSGRIFSSEELDKLAMLGSELAIALENARLVEESRNRADEQETLSKIAYEIMSIHNPIKLSQQIFTHIGKIVNYDRCIYLRWSDEDNSLMLEYAEGFDESVEEFLNKISLENESNIYYDKSLDDFDAEQISKIVENYLDEKKVKQAKEFSLSIPIFVGRKLYGVFCVFRTRGMYLEEQKRLLRTIGSQMVALHERMASTLAQAETVAITRTLRLIAHDMSHAFGILRGSLGLLQARLSKMSETDQHAASLINSEVKQLDRLITELKGLTDEENIRLRQEDVNVALNRALRLVESPLSTSNIEVTCNLQEVTMLVLIPGGQLTRVFFNLVLNAIQAMPQGGILKLTTKLKTRQTELGMRNENGKGARRQEGKELLAILPSCHLAPIRTPNSAVDIAEITISDTGCGISDEHLGKIFKSGFTTKEASSGFGLAEVKRIVNACDGKIEVNSQLEVGTTFIIQLPCYH
jgi:signal transduction histidine kinase